MGKGWLNRRLAPEGWRGLSGVVALLAWVVVISLPAAGVDSASLFNQKIRPILEQICQECHGEKKQKGDLRLDSYAALIKGGELGAVITPGDPAGSLLIKAVRYDDEKLKMPPKKKLSPEQVAALEEWVKSGAVWPGAGPIAVSAPVRKAEKQISAEDRNYWAYQPVHAQHPPSVNNIAWVRNPIDAFILAKLEAAGLSPSQPAGKLELVRRVHYDLTGLPPTPEQSREFLDDPSPEAYEKLVDRLLASPQYGLKWGRYWLDVVRYAETNGYERDGTKPNVWRYRDYVVRAFNQDKPYDQFIREQLAGDDLRPSTSDSIIASGYLRLGAWDDEPADPLQAEFDEYDDIVATSAQAFLAMSMNCARCHDHKKDPITQKDYYRFVAFFRDIPRYGGRGGIDVKVAQTDITPPEIRSKYEGKLKEQQARIDDLSARMTQLEDAAIAKMPAKDQRAAEGPDRAKVLKRQLHEYLGAEEWVGYELLKKERDALVRKSTIPPEMALSVNNARLNPPQTHVLVRGSPQAPADPVEPGFPSVLGSSDPSIPKPFKDAKSSGRRLALADWIASPANPLTSRVMVNRIWQGHFGRGIVRSASDFGKLGDKPTHPQLLDWLAGQFVSGGWKIKPMHKLIMTSNAYRQSSRGGEPGMTKDPLNDLFWHFDMRRLTAEELHDSILQVNGTLNLKMEGPGIYTQVPEAVLATASRPSAAWGKSPPEDQARRAIYIFRKRSLVEPMLASFDVPEGDTPCPVRFTTTVPTQALTMLNSQFMQRQSAAFARRLTREAGREPAAQVKLGLLLTLGRPPSDAEIARGLNLMSDLKIKDKLSEERCLELFCLMALNLNEFVYLD